MTIDWREAGARLDRWQRALAGAAERPPEEVARILAARAAALALPPHEAAPASPAGSVDLLVLSLAEERYAVEAAHVVEVVVPRELTSLPLVPDFLLGAVYHQGRMVPVLDLRRLMGLAGQACASAPVAASPKARAARIPFMFSSCGCRSIHHRMGTPRLGHHGAP